MTPVQIINHYNGHVSFWREIGEGAWQLEDDLSEATHYKPHGEMMPTPLDKSPDFN